MRPWITATQLNENGDLEVQFSYGDGSSLWLTVPALEAGVQDLVALAELAKPEPPASLKRGSEPA